MKSFRLCHRCLQHQLNELQTKTPVNSKVLAIFVNNGHAHANADSGHAQAVSETLMYPERSAERRRRNIREDVEFDMNQDHAQTAKAAAELKLGIDGFEDESTWSVDKLISHINREPKKEVMKICLEVFLGKSMTWDKIVLFVFRPGSRDYISALHFVFEANKIESH